MFPRWLSWLVMLVMAYLIYTSSGARAPGAPIVAPTVVPVITEKTYPALAELTDAERWKRKLNPDYAATHQCVLDGPADNDGLSLKVIEDMAGDGMGAACGDTIRVRLTLWDANGNKAYDGELPLTIGTRELAAGLDVGLLGIKPGGARTLILPPSAQHYSKSHLSENPVTTLRKQFTGKALVVVSVKRQKSLTTSR